MTRSESLERLAFLAGRRERLAPLRMPDYSQLRVAEAHGLAAVRAIDKTRDLALRGSYCESCAWSGVHEARAAFRAALSAVGLRTL